MSEREIGMLNKLSKNNLKIKINLQLSIDKLNLKPSRNRKSKIERLKRLPLKLSQ